MPVPSSLADLSTTAASNSPAGSDAIGTSLDDYLRTTQALLKQALSKGTDIASAGTIAIPNNGNYCVVTGTTGITSISDSWIGRTVILKFSGALTLTNSASLVLPGGVNLTVAAGDCATFTNESTGVWRFVSGYLSSVNLTNITYTGTITGGTGVVNLGSGQVYKNSSGDLSVGTTSASGRFTVVPASNAQYGIYAKSSSSGDVGNSQLVIEKFDNNTTTSQLFVQFRVNSSTLSGYITANGANSATFTSSSDSRLKENVVDISNQLDNICAMRPVEFDYKDGSGHQIGFIAQEVQSVYPDTVSAGNDGYLMLSGWSKTEARLVKAIQELKAEIDLLKAAATN